MYIYHSSEYKTEFCCQEEPRQAARSIVKQLVAAGFQLDQLLTMSQTRGLAQLELQVLDIIDNTEL